MFCSYTLLVICSCYWTILAFSRNLYFASLVQSTSCVLMLLFLSLLFHSRWLVSHKCFWACLLWSLFLPLFLSSPLLLNLFIQFTANDPQFLKVFFFSFTIMAIIQCHTISSLFLGLKDFLVTLLYCKKIVSELDQENHNHKPQTNPWHREEEPHNHHETPGRQTKQSKQLFLLH